MPIGIAHEIMPHVRFEVKDYGRNEEASRVAGRHIPNTATFLIITSHGSKDSSEHIANEWLERKRAEASRGMYKIEWVEHFERQYEAWKKGNELPRQGTPIATWQMLSPEQSTRIRAVGITTVEDLSAIPDSSVGEIGLDGRVLRDMARNWIAEGQQKGINAQELANAQSKLREQDATIGSLKSRLEALEAEILADVEEARPRKVRREQAA